MCWPKQKIKLHTGNGKTLEQRQSLRDLKDSLQQAIHNKLRLGQSNLESQWFKAWQDVLEHTDPKYSNAFWDILRSQRP